MKRFAQIAFAVVAIATILEYLFVFGSFTGPLAMALVWIVGIINIVVAAKDKKTNEAVLYLIATVALNMGYWKAMFF